MRLSLDFAPVGAGASGGRYVVGEGLESELVIYPSGRRMRSRRPRCAGSPALVRFT